MKRFSFFFALLISFANPISRTLAQDQAEAAAAIAARQDAEERNKRVNAAIEDLQSSSVALRKQIAALADELQKLREESTRANTGFATHDDLKQLAEKIREVDRKREADNKRVLETLEKLAKAPPPSLSVTPDKTEAPPSAKPTSEKNGYAYVIKKDDTLSDIIRVYRERGINVTRKQILEANPGLNPNLIVPGKKIFIPDPAMK